MSLHLAWNISSDIIIHAGFSLIALYELAQLAANSCEKEVCFYTHSTLTRGPSVKQYHIKYIVSTKYISL